MGSPIRPSLLVGTLALASCAGGGDDPREGQLATFFAQELQTLAVARPRLLTLRFDEMAVSPFRFVRGTEPLYVRDMQDASLAFAPPASFDTNPAFILLQGDAHPENIGVYGRQGDQHLELNDFDMAGFGPFHWEVLRAASSLAVALATLAVPETVRRLCVDALLHAYTDTMSQPDAGRPVRREDVGEVIARRFDKGLEDGLDREELDEFTVLDGNRRSLVRGNTDPEDIAEALLDVDPRVASAVPQVIGRLRATLWMDDQPDAFFAVKDVAHRCGQGVGSLTAIRLYVLIEGATADAGDDVVLQLKEATDASLDRWLPYDARGRDAAERVVARTRVLQSRPDADPLLGRGTLFGVPLVSRTVEDFQKTMRVDSDLSRVSDDPDTLARFARDFGMLLAHTHARSVTLDGSAARPLIVRAIDGRVESFVQTLGNRAMAYAALTADDHARLLRLRQKLGRDLGLTRPRRTDVPKATDPLSWMDPPCP